MFHLCRQPLIHNTVCFVGKPLYETNWLADIWTYGNKFHSYFSQNERIILHNITFGRVVCKISTICLGLASSKENVFLISVFLTRNILVVVVVQ